MEGLEVGESAKRSGRREAREAAIRSGVGRIKISDCVDIIYIYIERERERVIL